MPVNATAKQHPEEWMALAKHMVWALSLWVVFLAPLGIKAQEIPAELSALPSACYPGFRIPPAPPCGRRTDDDRDIRAGGESAKKSNACIDIDHDAEGKGIPDKL